MSIDIDKYLKDIEPDNVCGDDLEYDPDFVALEQDIKGKPEQQIGDTIQEAEPPNWREIKKSAEGLLERTRDLRVLIYYLRALIALEGLAGLNDGLRLIEALVSRRWETLYPLLDPDDDNDPTERVNIFMSLCDQETMLRPLHAVALVESKALGRFSFRDLMIATEKLTPSGSEHAATLSTIEAAVQDCEVESLQEKMVHIDSSLESLDKLENFVTQQVGINQAPNFTDLRNLVKEFKKTLADWLAARGADIVEGESIAQEATSSGEIAKSVTSPKSAPGAINNHQDVINTLKLICDYYKKNEPSSPIPMLLERASRLVGKSFMEVLKDIAPDGISQAEVIKGSTEEDE